MHSTIYKGCEIIDPYLLEYARDSFLESLFGNDIHSFHDYSNIYFYSIFYHHYSKDVNHAYIHAKYYIYFINDLQSYTNDNIKLLNLAYYFYHMYLTESSFILTSCLVARTILHKKFPIHFLWPLTISLKRISLNL